jgi:hypothetical protein
LLKVTTKSFRNGVAAEEPGISVEHTYLANFVAEGVNVCAVNAALPYALE